MAGGEAGAPGRQWIERADGRIEAIAGRAEAALETGDMLVIETPGGGGWGAELTRV
jgi:5-oxoprolinase (ATP-hydrolysing)